MFFRESFSKKYPNPILQLVENKRVGQKTSQQLIISLGRLEVKKEIRRQVADRVDNLLRGQETLFEKPKEIEDLANYIVKKIRSEGKWDCARRVRKITTPDNQVEEVFVNEIEQTDCCELGPELVAYEFFKKLDIDKILSNAGFNDIEVKSATVNIINRLVNPKTENNLNTWLFNTALPELLTLKKPDLSKSRHYRVADKLMLYKNKIELKLANQETTLFNLKRSIYLYDLTNTYFEGQQPLNPKAKYSGKSKEKRNDCLQVGVGLVVDEHGFPLQHKIFEGSKSDSKTLLGVIDDLKANFLDHAEKPTIIVDAGMSKDDHLNAIVDAGMNYIVTQKRTSRSSYSEIFEDDSLFSILPNRVNKSDVKIYKKIIDNQAILFCKSDARKQKELAITNNAHQKLKADLTKLENRIKNGRLKDKIKINKAIGRLNERHSRVARYYNITYDSNNNLLVWEYTNNFNQDKFHGCYIIKTNKLDLADTEIWHLYMTLLKVERAFRYLKSDLGLRPIFHFKEARVDSHIFISMLAYHLLRSIEFSLESHQDFRSWATIKQILETHCYATMIIPTKKGPVINLRKPGLPNSSQIDIYQKLNINYKNLPKKKIYA